MATIEISKIERFVELREKMKESKSRFSYLAHRLELLQATTGESGQWCLVNRPEGGEWHMAKVENIEVEHVAVIFNLLLEHERKRMEQAQAKYEAEVKALGIVFDKKEALDD